MATPLTHGLLSLAAGKTLFGGKMPRRFWLLAVFCSVLPDADTVSFRLGIPYAHLLGHRGLSHSLAFALILSLLVMALGFRQVRPLSRRWWAMWAFFFGLTASHGVLDAMTDGGLGVAFFSPFSNARHFGPFRPLRVAPIGMRYFFSRWGMEVILTEMLWLWGPALAVLILVTAARKMARAKRAATTAATEGKILTRQ